jgi:hypothetical protein
VETISPGRIPHSHWQRETNEDINGFSRQYFHKLSDLIQLRPEHLAGVPKRVPFDRDLRSRADHAQVYDKLSWQPV